MSYIYLSTNQANQYRNSLNEVLLKDILRFKLVAINSYKYNGQEYKFTYQNINQAINDINKPLIDTIENFNKSISDSLRNGRTYLENRIDATQGSYKIKYIDWDKPSNNDFHIAEDFVVQNENDGSNINFHNVLFVNGIPFKTIKREDELFYTEQLPWAQDNGSFIPVNTNPAFE